MFINGEWCAAAGGQTFEVTNPANGEKITDVPDGGQADAARAIQAAHNAFAGWSGMTAYERSRILYKAYELMSKRKEDIARTMTTEQGKPLRAAMNEVQYGADFLLWYAEEAKRVYGETIPAPRGDQRFIVLHQPVGVVAAVTPWNYPASMITRKVAPALAAGCTIVLKPAEATPLCAIEIFKVLEEAGVPEGLVKYLNTGQACICPNRLFVHKSGVEAFTNEFVSRVEKMRAGNGLDQGINIGPLVNEKAIEKVERQVADATEKGAKLLCGGHRLMDDGLDKGHYYAPTVLGNVTPDMLIYREETFGPVAPIIAFDDDDDILAMANDTHYGLAAYVYTQNLSAAMRTFEGLRFGIIGINDINPTGAAAPFGGQKESGLGREGGHEGISEYLETKLGGFSV
jgi:succinate-semialdehyde dehydrogenase/glutarate-semialdehyde dehydrogenase